MINEIVRFVNSMTEQVINEFPEELDVQKMKQFQQYFSDLVCHKIVARSRFLNYDRDSLESFYRRAVHASLVASLVEVPQDIEGREVLPEEFPEANQGNIARSRQILTVDNLTKLNAPYSRRLEWIRDYIKENPESDPNANELVEIGIAEHERYAGYVEREIEENQDNTALCQLLWNIRKSQFEESGAYPHLQEARLAYRICCDVYNDITGRPYLLMTQYALQDIARIDLFTAQEGLGAFNNPTELKNTLAHIEAAEMMQPEVMKDYGRAFKEKMKPHIERLEARSSSFCSPYVKREQ